MKRFRLRDDHKEKSAKTDHQGKYDADYAENVAGHSLAGFLGLGGRDQADDAEDDARNEEPAEDNAQDTQGLAGL